jgi:urease accessory protein
MVDVASAVVRAGRGRSDVLRARGAGPLRLLCPRAAGQAGWIVTSSLGGGLVDGDAVALEVTVEAGATGVVTTQASTKVFKGSSRQALHVTIEGDGAALVVPDPVVPYRDATFVQETKIAMTAASTLVACDVVTAGRVAHGERWRAARVDSALRIAIDGVPRVIDRIVIADGGRLGRFEALATCVLLGPRVREIAAAQLAALTTIRRGIPVIVAGSPVAGGAMFRIAGVRIADVIDATRALVAPACEACGELPWARKW